MTADKIYNVKNRSAATVVYRIPEDGIRRSFAPGEIKKIKFSELEKLTYRQGGRRLMADYLQIDKEVTEEFNIPTEPEYWMNENNVRELLVNGSVDALLDALDFGPDGVKDLIKQFAVSLPINDLEKIKAIKDKTGFDVSAALRHIEEEKFAEKQEGLQNTEGNKQRRVQPEEEKVTQGRRTAPQYKVINETKE
jgi:hypothetical protein